VAYRRHADILQIIGCQLRQHCPIDFVFAEGGLVSLETLAAQPRRYVHRAPPFNPSPHFSYRGVFGRQSLRREVERGEESGGCGVNVLVSTFASLIAGSDP
jgi:hypothetical protein